MKKTLICTLLISCSYLLLLPVISSNEAHSNNAGAPSARTGSPGDGANCSGCHGGSALVTNQTLISSNIPEEGYTPGNTYNITATISKPGINKFGFQVSPQNTTGQQKGTMIITNTTRTQLITSGKYITHKAAGTAGTSNSNTWDFQWTAPVAGTGALTFYGAFVAANGTGSSSGDQVFLSSLAVQENLSVGISDTQVKTDAKLFPLPCVNELFLEINNANVSLVNVDIYSIEGKKMQHNIYALDADKKIKLQTADLSEGTYIITARTKSGQVLIHSKFVKV